MEASRIIMHFVRMIFVCWSDSRGLKGLVEMAVADRLYVAMCQADDSSSVGFHPVIVSWMRDRWAELISTKSVVRQVKN